jgi:phosphoribosylanthranilate isomerase
MTKVKICGISEISHAAAAAAAGADFIGMVFAASRRKVSPENGREISGLFTVVKKHPQLIGVFAGALAAEVNRTADYCRLDYVQLSGGESWEYCAQIERPVIKTLHISPDTTPGELNDAITEGSRILGKKEFLILLDTGNAGVFGGTGRVFDWAKAREIALRYPVIVAGGLTPDNVSELISKVHPFGVDVSSGVESGGVKDPEKIKNFIRAVKQADAL